MLPRNQEKIKKIPKSGFLRPKTPKSTSQPKGAFFTSAWDRADLSTFFYVPVQKFDPANLYPEPKPSYHRFRYRKGETPDDVFEKYHTPLQIAIDDEGAEILHDDHTALLTKREVETCELFRDHPHRNIANYRGVVYSSSLRYGHPSGEIHVPFDTERILKLVFKRYDCTLWQLVTHHQAVNVKQCLESIAAGIMHMHSRGMVHGDVKPKNIFASAEEGKDPKHSLLYVIGDFDSTHKTGSRIKLKSGDLKWTRRKRSGDFAEEDDDWYAFNMVKEWLLKSTGAKLSDLEGIGKNVVKGKGRR